VRAGTGRAIRGFTLVELLVVLGLTAIIAVPLGELLRGTVTSQERTAERAREWQVAAGLMARLSDEIRSADEARALTPNHLKLTVSGEVVHYRGGKGLHRIEPVQGGGRWRTESTETLLDGADGTEMYFHVDREGLVTLYLVGEEIRLRTAALPRGGVVDVVLEEAPDPAGGAGGNRGGGNGGGQGNDKGNGKGK